MSVMDLLNANDVDVILLKHGIDPDNVPCGAYCGAGWAPLIDQLITDLVALGWDQQISQIKEKFGQLRFYIPQCESNLLGLIDAASLKSEKTCEACGQPGNNSAWRGSWYKTLCPAHGKEWASIK